MGWSCFAEQEPWQTVLSVEVQLRGGGKACGVGTEAQAVVFAGAAQQPGAPLVECARALRAALLQLCPSLRGVATTDVLLKAWPPSNTKPGVIMFKCLVDHGEGVAARRSAAALAAACKPGGPARVALASALAAAAPAELCVDAVMLLLLPAEQPPAVAPAQAAEPSTPPLAAAHPSAALTQALRRMGVGSFREDAFLDGSVHSGQLRGAAFEPQELRAHGGSGIAVVGGGRTYHDG